MPPAIKQRGLSVVVALFSVAGLSQPRAVAQVRQPQWVKPALPLLPSARCCASLTYDSARDTVVLFGGGVSGASFADTWIFTKANGWSQRTPAVAPPPRSGAAFAYDPISNTAVLFGGNPGNFVYLSDTWTWDGSTWTQEFPPVAPSARAFNTQQMVFDRAHGEVVLFGGFATGGASFVGDTWIWNGSTKTWAQRFPVHTPSPRGTTLAYDAARGQVILFGGQNNSSHALADTWTWDGTDWIEQFPPTSPPARNDHTMEDDPGIGEVVLFGGNSPNQKLNDTWSWNGSTWRQIQTPFTPAPRSGAWAKYDRAIPAVVLFGGILWNRTFTNQTWLLH